MSYDAVMAAPPPPLAAGRAPSAAAVTATQLARLVPAGSSLARRKDAELQCRWEVVKGGSGTSLKRSGSGRKWARHVRTVGSLAAGCSPECCPFCPVCAIVLGRLLRRPGG